MLNNLKALEMNPHGMSGIRQAAGCEGLSGKQMAILIIPAWEWDPEQRHEGEPNRQSRKAYEADGQNFLPS
jgi:hypothetical protein